MQAYAEAVLRLIDELCGGRSWEGDTDGLPTLRPRHPPARPTSGSVELLQLRRQGPCPAAAERSATMLNWLKHSTTRTVLSGLSGSASSSAGDGAVLGTPIWMRETQPDSHHNLPRCGPQIRVVHPQASFPVPIVITAHTMYVASHFAPNGHYGSDRACLRMLTSARRRCTYCRWGGQWGMACTSTPTHPCSRPALITGPTTEEEAVTSPIGLAVIGAGYRGPNLIRTALATPAIQLEWLYDLDEARAQKVLGRNTTVKTSAWYDAVLRDPAVAAVAIACIRVPVTTEANT